MDISAPIVKSFERACAIFSQDLDALPDEAFFKSLGGKARTVADIVTEVNMVNDHVCIVMEGKTPFPWPEDGWITAPSDMDTRDKVILSFKDSSQRCQEIVRSFNEAKFLEPLVTEDSTTTRLERVRFMTLHIWYHSGQLNFIQTLLGDDGGHWS